MASLLTKSYARYAGQGHNVGTPEAPVFVVATSEQTRRDARPSGRMILLVKAN